MSHRDIYLFELSPSKIKKHYHLFRDLPAHVYILLLLGSPLNGTMQYFLFSCHKCVVHRPKNMHREFMSRG